jgi:hypothetical protein
METLATWAIEMAGQVRSIELLQGDLSHLPPEHAVDFLVVSAFQGDYLPTSTSLIGGLDRAGLSVSELAEDKEVDLRQQFSCWLSKPVPTTFHFRRILCIESGWRGTPPEIIDDLFRALSPYLLTELPNSSIAMPLIGTGDQGYPPELMLRTILGTTVQWMERGLPLHVLKIVVRSPDVAERARQAFEESKTKKNKPASKVARRFYDVFVSYAREDKDMAGYLVDKLQGDEQSVDIFYDQSALREGATWPLQIAMALDSSRRVVTLYSASYWRSKNCQSEFLAALTRQNDTGGTILFPIYLSDADIPYLFRTLQFSDCRIRDRDKVASACSRLLNDLNGLLGAE